MRNYAPGQDDFVEVWIWKGGTVSGKNEDEHSRPPPQREDDASARPVSDRTLAIFFVALATALLLGYLLLSKLADISQEEDCALAHRKTCGASELSSPARLAASDAVQPAGRQPPGGV